MKCDELKAFDSERIYWAVEQVEREAGDIDDLHLDDTLFYLKSEADREIRKQKRKRCLALAKWCHALTAHFQMLENYKRRDRFRKWMFRFYNLADKFKDKEA